MKKKLIKTCHIVKELPDQKPSDDGMWAIASCEKVDVEGDLIRVKALDYSKYHQPPKRYLKIVPSHQYSIPDGTPAVVGRVEEFKVMDIPIDGELVKSLLFRFTWAKDGEGQLLPLASIYKRLFDGDYLDSFSIGMMIEEAHETDTGIEVTKGILYEISPVVIPANANANRLKHIAKELGIEEQIEEQQAEVPEDVQKALEVVQKAFEAGIEEGIQKALEGQMEAYAKVINNALQPLLTTFKRIDSQLSAMESALIVMSDKQKEVEEIKEIKEIKNDKEAELFKTFNQKLDELSKTITR